MLIAGATSSTLLTWPYTAVFMYNLMSIAWNSNSTGYRAVGRSTLSSYRMCLNIGTLYTAVYCVAWTAVHCVCRHSDCDYEEWIGLNVVDDWQWNNYFTAVSLPLLLMVLRRMFDLRMFDLRLSKTVVLQAAARRYTARRRYTAVHSTAQPNLHKLDEELEMSQIDVKLCTPTSTGAIIEADFDAADPDPFHMFQLSPDEANQVCHHTIPSLTCPQNP